MNVLSFYKVRFYNKVFISEEFKMLDCSIEGVGSFILSGCPDVSSSNQVIDGINAVMSNSIPVFHSTTQALDFVVITQSLTKFYDEHEYLQDPDTEPISHLPTAHFKVILEAWRNFLQS